MPMSELPTFRVRAFGSVHVSRALDHLSDGERAALAAGNLSALQARRQLRWN